MANRRQRRQRRHALPARRGGQGRRRTSRRRQQQATFREIFSGASRRAWNRSHRTSVQQAIADSHVGELVGDFMVRHLWLRRLLAIFLLLPLSIVSTYAFFSQLSSARLDFWLQREFWYFTMGCVLWTAVFLTGLFRKWWLYLYVLGHELTHGMFALCSLGRLGRLEVSTEGGFVETTKTSLIIALSPYFVPFWSILGMSLYFIASAIWGLPSMPVYLLIFIGFTWGFHLIWTLWMIPKDQPDLRENGVLFSLLFVYLVNLAMILLLLVLASAVSPREFLGHWWEAFLAGREAFLAVVRWLYQLSA